MQSKQSQRREHLSMADPDHSQQEEQESTEGGPHDHLSGGSLCCASIAGLAVGGPLLSMSGFSFMASVTLLLISSPLLLTFSPVLLSAGLLLVGVMSAFGVAFAMGLAGTSTISWVLRSAFKGREDGCDDAVEQVLKEAAGESVATDQHQHGKHLAEDLRQKTQENKPAGDQAREVQVE